MLPHFELLPTAPAEKKTKQKQTNKKQRKTSQASLNTEKHIFQYDTNTSLKVIH
jgi:hypothetical protein